MAAAKKKTAAKKMPRNARGAESQPAPPALRGRKRPSRTDSMAKDKKAETDADGNILEKVKPSELPLADAIDVTAGRPKRKHRTEGFVARQGEPYKRPRDEQELGRLQTHIWQQVLEELAELVKEAPPGTSRYDLYSLTLRAGIPIMREHYRARKSTAA